MSDSVRILVVDDHEDIREPLAAYLSRYNLEVTVAADGAGMRNALARSRFDLIVLDVMLPGEDGLSLCRWVHEHLRTPVILLTAMADTADRVAGLEMGADDYMVKPFEPRELVARIRGVLRRLRMAQPEAMQAPRDGVRRYGFGRWVLDVGRRELYGEGGRAVQLGAAEFRLLQALVEQAHIVDAYSFELAKVERMAIREREVNEILANIDLDLARRVAANIGVQPPAAGTVELPKVRQEQSPALSQMNLLTGNIRSRKIAILIGNGVDAAAVSAAQAALKGEGAACKLVAPSAAPVSVRGSTPVGLAASMSPRKPSMDGTPDQSSLTLIRAESLQS